MEAVEAGVIFLQDYVNSMCEGKPAWKIVVTTAGTTLLLLWLKEFLFQGESLFVRGKKFFFRLVRRIPQVRAKIEEEINKVSESMEKEMNENIKHAGYLTSLPSKGWSVEEIIKETEEYCGYGTFDWESGCASGTVYNGNKILTELMTKVYGMSAWTNPLHADVFPGVRKMEAEVVRMCCTIYNGGPLSCGTMTSGGTESIIMAIKAYREYAKNVKGIKNPEIVVPITAHAAFDKGCQLLHIRIKHIPIDPVSMKVDVNAMEKAITKNTIMLAGSAPQFPHGVVDPIEEIADLGVKYDIPVHVDACLGGFLIPFMKEAGYLLPLFDFCVEGVTSISADTHKYGYAPKGSSVIMYSDEKWRHYQYFVCPDWPGGIYATSTISGSRAGGIIAACWASLMYHGHLGYVEYTKKIIDTTKLIEKGCRTIPGIKVMGKPDVSIVALGSDDFNIYMLSDGMSKKGWNLNALQFPPCIHIAVTVLHTQPGVVEKFVNDVTEIATEIMKNPPKELGGSAAIYGMAQSVPDRSLVGEMAWCYLDAVYSTRASEKEKNQM
ncbi:sphingosine-1-phosphate lyase [Oratosquilla oratoria]|uniref:sphingosine-1-phosphate lyase n=1 Tax=Oratosquilla oratoria TaxID=337810 RepID=UPI003F7737B4